MDLPQTPISNGFYQQQSSTPFHPMPSPFNTSNVNTGQYSDVGSANDPPRSLPLPAPVFAAPTTEKENSPPSQNLVIPALVIDNLAKDFKLEPHQRAKLHSFVSVSGLPFRTCIS